MSARLFQATSAEHVAAALAAGEDIEAVDWAGCTPLIRAADFRHVDAARALIAAGANVNATSSETSTALHYASWRNLAELVDILITAGADVNARDHWGVTPLFDSRDCVVTTMLCDAGADINARDSCNETPLSHKLTYCVWKSALALIQHGADVSDPRLLFRVVRQI